MHSVQTNKMFVDVRRGGEKKNCSSMFVVVRRCSSLFVVGCPCGRDLFVDVRRCSSTNIDEQNRRTFCSSTNQKCSSAHYAYGGGGLGGRIVLTKSEIKIFCDIDTRFPWKTRHIPTPKMFGGSNETIFLHFGGLRNTQNGEN